MIDPYQVPESRALGADCILLIMACLDRYAMAADLARGSRTMPGAWTCWSRCMTAPELERALKLDADLIGVNNRNLKTLAVDLATTETACADGAEGPRAGVAESGLGSPCRTSRAWPRSALGFLIGESFMRKPDVEAAVRDDDRRPREAA